MVVIVAQELRRHPEGGGPVIAQVDVLEAVELVEEADPFEVHPGGLVLCFKDAEAAVLPQRGGGGPSAPPPGRKTALSPPRTSPRPFGPETAEHAAPTPQSRA